MPEKSNMPKLGDLLTLGRLKKWNDRLKKERKAHRLNYLFWETTRACNLRCRHCGSDCSVPKENELTTAEVKEAFASIARDFDARSIMLSVTGGEPFLRKDLFDVMGYVSGLGFPWGVVTNGELVTRDIVRKCREVGMSTVTVSVDGMKQAHEYLRKGGSFDRAVRALELFKEAGCFRVIQPTTCVSQYNIGDLPGLHDLVSRMRMDEWRLLTIFPLGRAREDPRFRLMPSQLRQLFDFIAYHRKAGGLRVTYGEEGFLGTEYEGKVRDLLYYCPAGINVGSILCDGSISACPSLPDNFIQGNVRIDRFRDVWENGFTNMRDVRWKKAGKCADCPWWENCRGNSMHLWDFSTGAPVMCHVQELERSKQQ